MTLDDPLHGVLLDGRYRIEQRIAVGGMATVYRGTDTRLDRTVALKLMHPSLIGDADFTARFIREAKAVARLAHPNVVNVLDQGADPRAVFMAMEYVPGRNLRDVLRDRGALSVRAALDVLEPVLAALGAAHRAGLVHRDVKPENVLITDNGMVKVADFGLVRVLEGGDATGASATETGQLLGTVSYLAPEQIRQEPTDQRVDVYAAGILLYEMLTGAKPHTGEHAAQVMYRHLHEDVPAPSLTAPAVGPELDAIVAAATSRDPQARPWDAVELLAAVQRARRSLPVEQLDAEPPASTRPTPRYSPGEATAVLEQLPPLERTSVLEVPPELLPPVRPVVNDDPPRGRPRRSPRSAFGRHPAAWSAVLVALLLVVGGVTYALSSAVYATVPSVLGQNREQAAATLDRQGLHGSFSEQFSESVPNGSVISTDPGVGAKVRKSDGVKVLLSRGPERVAVPDVTGRPQADAAKALGDARLTAGTSREEYSDTVPKGSVISTDPAAGSSQSPGSPVALTVSKGMHVVPDVKGMGKEDASKALQDAGFVPEIAGLIPLGKVTGQSPAANTPAKQGSTVTITISLF
ncbi:Stk1 family PASTA domain-containing Ser/Thr kinase [Kitasatospora sp. NA04385]|uniref:Stk1 family PASTA domain-containing Ser/Thr kinase n=1 Tax=Kitasatospora sp. NA04385 TaxID=2742135 RepID=UPI0020CB5A51|nr:Stk1 family PASTA domain-containing Ser/Thr kinase [Kitasatospora sp. NA04385]